MLTHSRFTCAVLLLIVLVCPARAQTFCVGDCDGNARVAVNELVLGVNIALDRAALSACRAFDADGDERVMVNELVRAVDAALLGCGVPTQTPTPTPTDTETPTQSPVPFVCGDGVASGPEECDDGNGESGDGCAADCQLEPGGNVCAGVPVVAGTRLKAVVAVSDLSRPLFVTAPRLDPHRLFVVEQGGRIRVVRDGTLLVPSYLNLVDTVSCCGERGLLGLAFHPDFEQNGRFFVNYTNRAGNTVIARYHADPNADSADADSGQILLTISQPFANHNGGDIVFGPDGYMYVGMGDGGSANDPRENGQSDTTLLGKLLRIDVNVETEPFYAVPPTNPRPDAAAPFGLIWAKGLRNPWRFSFDRANDNLYIADVGQNEIEEIDVQPATSTGGENYGWDIFEGDACFEPKPLFDECPDRAPYRFPVVQYTHAEGCSVTGGYVYRGCTQPDVHGTYFYADYCTSFVRSFVYADGAATLPRDWTQDLAPGQGLRLGDISSFGEDARGELYLTNLSAGIVFKIVPAE